MNSALADLIDLGGKRALVTGGVRGIGAAIASRLREAGAHVTVADLAVGDLAEAVACDITDPRQLESAFDLAADAAGLDIVVNNAGIYPPTGPIENATDEFIARMLDVNVRAQFSATREAVNHMPHGGSIINVASIAGLRGGLNLSAYAASKAAVIMMTRAHANELGPKGIRVNAVAPGIIDTPGVQQQMEPLRAEGVDIQRRIAANPLGIAGQPDHIARAVLVLASDLSEFVSGHTMVVDGGDSA